MNNTRTITVKGAGTVSVNPDLIILSMSLDTCDFDYETTIQKAAHNIAAMRTALAAAGYEKDSLKTTDFKINADYESYKDDSGEWKQKFNGYLCTHKLKLEFDYSMEQLNKTLLSLMKCSAPPTFNINFSVKDTAAVSEQLLINAVINATKKAEILATASNVKLCDILSIDYSWGELRLISDMRLSEPLVCATDSAIDLDISPDDIKANDTVTITWAIE